MKTRIKTKKYSSTKKRHHKQNKILLGIAVILFFVLVGLLLYNFGVFEEEREVVKVEVLDECANIMGNLIHTFQDEGGCKIKCMNNCEIRGLDFYESVFTYQNSTCHTCDCYCQ